MIRLNVGGKEFVSTRDTLRKASYFEALLSDRWNGANEPVFVDRSPTGFKHVLELLRDAQYPFPWMRWGHELIFYGIDATPADPDCPLPARSSEYDFRLDLSLTNQLFCFYAHAAQGLENYQTRSLVPTTEAFFAGHVELPNSSDPIGAYEQCVLLDAIARDPSLTQHSRIPDSVFELGPERNSWAVELTGLWIYFVMPEAKKKDGPRRDAKDIDWVLSGRLARVLKRVTVTVDRLHQTFSVEQLARRFSLRNPKDDRYTRFWSRAVEGDDESPASLLHRIEGHDPNIFRLWLPAFEFWHADGTETWQTFPLVVTDEKILVSLQWVQEADIVPEKCQLLARLRHFASVETFDFCQAAFDETRRTMMVSASSKIYKAIPHDGDALRFDLERQMSGRPIVGMTFALERRFKEPNEVERGVAEKGRANWVRRRISSVRFELHRGTNSWWTAGELELLHDMARRGLHPTDPVYDACFQHTPWSFSRVETDGTIDVVPHEPADCETYDYFLHVDWRQTSVVALGKSFAMHMFSE